MHHFFVAQSSIRDDLVRLRADQVHQVCHVLRLKVGDEIVVLDNAGHEYDVTLTGVAKREVIGRITERRTSLGEPKVNITLFQSLLAREKFEWVLQKGTEVGISRFVPVATARSLVRARQIDAKKLARWRKILTEAAEQSHRGRIPEIEGAIGCAEAMAQSSGFDLALIASPGAESEPLKQVLGSRRVSPTSVALFIGPEGGFALEEIEQAGPNGVTPVRLGPRVFRAETAGAVTTAIILYELDNLGQ